MSCNANFLTKSLISNPFMLVLRAVIYFVVDQFWFWHFRNHLRDRYKSHISFRGKIWANKHHFLSMIAFCSMICQFLLRKVLKNKVFIQNVPRTRKMEFRQSWETLLSHHPSFSSSKFENSYNCITLSLILLNVDTQFSQEVNVSTFSWGSQLTAVYSWKGKTSKFSAVFESR